MAAAAELSKLKPTITVAIIARENMGRFAADQSTNMPVDSTGGEL
jgi:hypothetical protein